MKTFSTASDYGPKTMTLKDSSSPNSPNLKMARKNWHYHVSLFLPFLSILLVTIVINLDNPQATGLAVLVPQPVEQVDAQLSITIKENEFIPIGSFVQLRYANQIGSIPLQKILAAQLEEPDIIIYRNPQLNYAGRGILGPQTLTFKLSDFSLDRTLVSSPIEITFFHNTRVLSKTIATIE